MRAVGMIHHQFLTSKRFSKLHRDVLGVMPTELHLPYFTERRALLGRTFLGVLGEAAAGTLHGVLNDSGLRVHPAAGRCSRKRLRGASSTTPASGWP